MYTLEKELAVGETCVEVARHADLGAILGEFEAQLKADPTSEYYLCKTALVERKVNLTDDELGVFIDLEHQVRRELKRGDK